MAQVGTPSAIYEQPDSCWVAGFIGDINLIEGRLVATGVAVVVTVVLLLSVAYTVLLERKLVGRIQNRWGPSRVGPFGLLQPLVDGAKSFLKEDIIPTAVYRPLYLLAPIIANAVFTVGGGALTLYRGLHH